MAKIISFSSSKGGVGKTTLNSLLANYLALNSNKKVLLIDCDEHKSMSYISDYYQKIKEKKILYDFVCIPASQLDGFIEGFDEEYDYIVIDLPGTISQRGVLEAYVYVEYLFIPLLISLPDILTTHNFINSIIAKLEELRKNMKLPDLHVFGVYNKVNLSYSNDKQCIVYNDSPYSKLNIRILDTYLPQCQSLKTNFGIDTFMELSKNESILKFCKNIETIINK